MGDGIYVEGANLMIDTTTQISLSTLQALRAVLRTHQPVSNWQMGLYCCECFRLNPDTGSYDASRWPCPTLEAVMEALDWASNSPDGGTIWSLTDWVDAEIAHLKQPALYATARRGVRP